VLNAIFPNVLSLLRRHRRFFLGTALAGVALRLFFIVYFPAVTDDSRIYADFATNWLQHGIYGLKQSGGIAPSDTRLPGYPGFLAVIFALFGPGNFRAVMLVQILVDLGTCFIIADLARRTTYDRAARISFVLAALCPFLANYAAAVLTETLEVFFTAMALDCAVAGLDQLNQERLDWKAWAGAGVSIAGCILLRPD
jgi:4-amino-4-deoxy-L-arabinose transferase-like glycosyltransferase